MPRKPQPDFVADVKLPLLNITAVISIATAAIAAAVAAATVGECVGSRGLHPDPVEHERVVGLEEDKGSIGDTKLVPAGIVWVAGRKGRDKELCACKGEDPRGAVDVASLHAMHATGVIVPILCAQALMCIQLLQFSLTLPLLFPNTHTLTYKYTHESQRRSLLTRRACCSTVVEGGSLNRNPSTL